MFALFVKTSAECSKTIALSYSTSFSMGIRTLNKRFHAPIYGIYGMVRYADEIVDTFHDFDKKYLLQKFKQDTFEAIEQRISLNPLLFSFQKAVHDYNIPLELVEGFFHSMEMDLYETAYGEEGYQEYIYGSAEVVGLMCLRVFSEGDVQLYERLRVPARALGAALQKVNFLRDMKSDYEERGRMYFPGVDFNHFSDDAKRKIEMEIAEDFEAAYAGILQLPVDARGGVMLAYKYYTALFNRIKKISVSKIKQTRVRVPGIQKIFMLIEV